MESLPPFFLSLGRERSCPAGTIRYLPPRPRFSKERRVLRLAGKGGRAELAGRGVEGQTIDPAARAARVGPDVVSDGLGARDRRERGGHEQVARGEAGGAWADGSRSRALHP